MHFSARNQLTGRLTHVRRGTSNDEVEITLAGGERILTLLTSERALIMGIKPGDEAIAVINAASIILGNEQCSRFKLSARNQLPGVIRELNVGPAYAEVILSLKGKDTLVAIVPNSSVSDLGLAVGQRVLAIFKASNVILGVAN